MKQVLAMGEALIDFIPAPVSAAVRRQMWLRLRQSLAAKAVWSRSWGKMRSVIIS